MASLCKRNTTNIALIFQVWRRERDSNPRYGLTYTRFPGVRLQPLGHLSTSFLIVPIYRSEHRQILARCTDETGTLHRKYWHVDQYDGLRYRKRGRNNNGGAPSLPRKKSTSPDFEHSLNELETLVEQMEQGDISLERSLELFERGIKLTRSCQESLKKAELRVQQLVEKNGVNRLEDFADANEDAKTETPQ